MPRLPDFRQIDLPMVSRQPYLARYQDRSSVMVDIKCPRCCLVRCRPASEIRKESLRINFRGLCRPCALASVSDGTHRWKVSTSRADINAKQMNGYRFILPRDVSDDLLPMYRQMQAHGQPIMAHRWAMSVHLGRPLTSNELVDHMNGNKNDNDVANLRIYIRGKQQPGSAPGHGTFYHEWQLALRRVVELEAMLL